MIIQEKLAQEKVAEAGTSSTAGSNPSTSAAAAADAIIAASAVAQPSAAAAAAGSTGVNLTGDPSSTLVQSAERRTVESEEDLVNSQHLQVS